MNFFEDLLVIVNFNHPYYVNVPFLKEIYKDFPHLVFYGDDTNINPPLEIIRCNQEKGYFAYRVVLDAIQRFPGYNGYLFLMDDLLINPWNLKTKDKNKVWLTALGGRDLRLVALNVMNSLRTDWWFGNERVGLKACRKAWLELPEEYRNRLVFRLGQDGAFACWYGDIFYLPKRLVNDFLRVFTVMSNNEVFLELAIPTGFCAIEDFHNWEWLSIEFLQRARRTRWRDFYNKSIDGLHPVKFAELNNRETVKLLFDNKERSYLERTKMFLLKAKFSIIGRIQGFFEGCIFWKERVKSFMKDPVGKIKKIGKLIMQRLNKKQ